MGVKLQSALGGSVELTAPSTASTYTLAVPAGNGTVATTDQLNGWKNKVINGDFAIWQRGSSNITAGSGYQRLFRADRFYIEGSSISGTTYGYGGTSVIEGVAEDYALVVTAGGGTTDLFQGIERGFRDYSSRTMTLSMWLWGSGTVQLASWDANSGAVLRGNSISLTSTPTRYTATFTLGSWSSGSQHLYVGVRMNNGSTVRVTRVQFEEGSVATNWERRPQVVEQRYCERYYQQLGNLQYVTIGVGRQQSATQSQFYVKYNTTMCAAPSVAFSNLISTERTSFDATCSSISALSASVENLYITFTTASAGTANTVVFLTPANLTTGYLSLTSEL